MKKVTKLLLLVSALSAVAILPACKKNQEEKPEEPPVLTEPVDENEVYYFEENGKEYLFSIAVDKFTIHAFDKALTGSIQKVDGVYEFKFDNTDVNASAKFENDTLVLTYEGSDYKFLKKVNYTVTFDTDNGSVSTVSVLNGKTVAKPSNPTKDGSTFVGWYTSKSYDTVFDFEHTVVTKDLTVYARYVENEVGKSEYTVKYYLEDQLYETTQTVSGKILSLPVPTQQGKEFVGWWVSLTGNKDELTYQYKDQVLTENTTLFAVWKSDAPLVSVTVAGASWTSVSSDNIMYTVIVKDATDKTIVNTTTNSLKYDIDFASMEPGVYTVSVTGNGKTGVGHYTNKMLDKVSLFSVVEPNLLVFSPVPNATKYLLYVDCKNDSHQHNPYDLGKNTYYDFSNCEMQEGGITFKVVASAKGYAESTSEEFVYNRQLDAVTGLTVKNNQVIWNPVLKATSYVVEIKSGDQTDTFNVGNVTSYDLKYYTGDLSISVYPYTAGYNTTKVDAIPYTKATLAAPKNVTVEGTTVQWDAVDGATSYSVNISGTVSKATTNTLALTDDVLAKADVLEITVQAVADKAENNSAYSDAITVNCKGLVSEIRYEDGKIYWDYVVGATKYVVQVGDEKEFEVTSGTSAPVTFKNSGDTTIRVCSYNENTGYSDWMETTVNVQTIYFDGCGGVALKPIYKVVGDTVQLPTTTYTGYEFAGWYNMAFGPEANALEYQSGLTMPSKNLYLYAYWTSMPYEITLSGFDDRGTLEETSKVVYFDKAFTLPVPTPTTSNFVFEGWYTEMNGVGQKIADLNGNSVVKWNIASDKTIYANWVNVIDYVALSPSGEVIGYRAVPGAGFDLVTEAKIAATYENLPVVDLGSFAGKSKIKVLNIPSTIQAISTELGFTGCKSLEAINIYQVEDQSIEPVYASYEGILYYNNTASELSGWQLEFFPNAKEGECHIMPGTVHIPANSLDSADITSIYIPSSVKKIGEEAFYYSDVELVVFEPTKEGEEEVPLTIDQRAFYGTNIINITLPKRLVSFDVLFTQTDYGYVEDNTMFAGCYDLENINFEEGTTKYVSKDGIVCNENGTKILYSPQAKTGTLRIPEGVRVIGYRAFYSCDMEELIIPGAVTEIEAEAFYSCYSLKNIQFEGDADSEPLKIGSQAFYDSSLTSIVIPENAQTIEAYAFGGNFTLSQVTILTSGDCSFASGITQSKPYSEGSLGSSYVTKLIIGPNVKEFNVGGAFNGSNNRLQTIEIDPKNQSFAVKDDVVYNKDLTKLLFYPSSKPGEFVVPDTVTEISDGAFMYKDNLTKITIGKNVAKIGNNAFASCGKLKTVIFAEGGTAKLEISDGAFKNCESLQDITFPSRLLSIGASAFEECEGFTAIVLPEGVTSIGEYAFRNCLNVTRFYIPSTLEQIGDYVGEAGTSITVLDGCNSLASIEVAAEHDLFASSDGVLYLKTNGVVTTLCLCPIARSGDLVIPKTVNSINARAFYENSLIKNISFEDGKSAVTVEAGIETEGVLTIGASAFQDCTALETIQLPNITTLGESMFDGCKSLTTFEVPNTVGTIENSAFSYCTSLKFLTFEAGNDTLPLEIKDAKYSSYSPFSNVTSLETIALPARTTVIGDYAFYSCKILNSCVIPEGVTKIGQYAFYQCKELVTMTIPSSVTTFGSIVTNWNGTTTLAGDVFNSCDKLTEVTFGADSQIKSIPTRTFVNCKSLTKITLPKELETIDASAFNGCEKLASIDIPATVLSIGDSAFYDCSSLTRFTISSNVETLGKSAFYNCKALESIDFAADTNIEVINEGTFVGCEKLTSVVVPASVKIIGKNAFKDTPLLTSITFAGENVHTINGRAFENSGLTSFTFPTLKIDGKVQAFTAIEAEIFAGCMSLETVTLSGSFNKAFKVFYGCSSIKNVIVDETNENFAVTKANDVVLLTNKDGSNIKAVFGEVVGSYTVPSTIKIIEAYAFANQSKLTDVIISNSVNEIGDFAFAANAALKTVQFESGSPITKGDVLIKKEYDYTTYQNIYTYSAGQSPNTLGAYVFSDCVALTTVALPENMVNIPEYTFDSCISLSNVTLPSVLTKIDQYAFFDAKKLSNLTLPATLEEIGTYAFSGSGLVSAILPASIKTLGNEAFSDCTNLKTVELPEGLSSMGSNCFENTAIEKIVIPSSLSTLASYAFKDCTLLASVTISEGVVELGSNAFRNCISLKTLDIPASVESLGSDLFWESGIERLTIPETVKKVDSYIFEDCANLKEVVFNAQIAELPGQTFSGCENLTSVILSDNITTIGSSAFYGCISLTEIKLPSQLKKIYNYAFQNSGIRSIEIPESVEALGGSGWSTPTVNTTTHVFSDCLELESVIVKSTLLTYIGAETFNNTPKLAKVVLPNSITEIGSRAFKGSGLLSFDNSNITGLGDEVFADCTALVRVSLPSLLTIGKGLFTNCALLSNVAISQNLKTMTQNIFSGCSALTTIELPAITETIEKNAFADCIALSEIVIPETVTSIGENAFAGCLKLAQVTFDGNSRLFTIANSAFENCEMIKSFTIPESVTTIGDFAFRGTSISGELFIPSKVESMGYNPFGSLGQIEVVIDSSNPFFSNNEQGAVYMANVLIYYPVSTIGSVTLPSGVEIRPYAFYNCNLITKIELPNDITTITEACFAGMGGLQELVVPESVTKIAKNAFYKSSIETLTLPSSVTLEPYALSGLKTRSITMPTAMTAIPIYCFLEAEIEEVILPDGLLEVGSHAVENSTITKFDLPASVKVLQNYAFSGSAFETFTLPNTIEDLGTYLFAYSENLREVTFADGITKIDSSSCFDGCTSLEVVNLPSGITELPYGFFQNSGLKSFTLPEGFKATSSQLFSGCAQLASITFPSTLEKIASYSFQNCTSLTSVTLPAGLKELGSYSFAGCTGLTSVTMPDNLEVMDSAVFQDCTGIKELVIKGNVSLADCWTGAFYNWTEDQTIKFTCSEELTLTWEKYWNEKCLAKIIFDYVA